jgi:hypothetical protein
MFDACGPQSPRAAQSTDQGSPLAIATDSEVRAAGMTALFDGTIHGSVNSDRTACFRMSELPDLPTFWPHGYSARTNPLRVVDDRGKTVAVDGQQVKLAGGIADLHKTQAIVGCGEADKVLAVG